LAVAEALSRSGRDGDVLFVGRRGGVAEDLVERSGIRLETLDIHGLHLTSPLSVARFAGLLPRAVARARRLIREFDADVIIGAAGYLCVPVVMAARREGRPVLLMEQNAVPGKAVRLLRRRAHRVAVSFEETASLLPGARVVITGNPVRAAFQGGPAPLREHCSQLLFMGGSQGARQINRALAGCVEALLRAWPTLRIVQQCGRLDEAEMREAHSRLDASLRQRWTMEPFFNDMASEIRGADLIVMRAGGSSLAEVSALGRPMILIPYQHAGDHQKHNARPYVDGGAARLIPDMDCDATRLHTEIDALLGDEPSWQEMAEVSGHMGRPDAAARVVELVRELGMSA